MCAADERARAAEIQAWGRGRRGTEANQAAYDEERVLGKPLLDDAWEAAACRCGAGIRSEGRAAARSGREAGACVMGGWARTAYEENEPLLEDG